MAISIRMHVWAAVVCSIVIAVCSLTSAEEKVISAKYIEQHGTAVSVVLPCNWNGMVDDTNLKVYSYYGTNEEGRAGTLYQDKVTPTLLQKHGLNVLLDFPVTVMTHANGKPLHHIGVWFVTTEKKCGSGFDMNQLTR